MASTTISGQCSSDLRATLAGTDVDDLRTTSRKISARFDEIERVELEPGQAAQPQLGGLAAGEEG